MEIYRQNFSADQGRGAVNPRCVIGASIIKHKLGLSDEETLLTISENPYMQFFLGLETYHPPPLFVPTLFVELHKKLVEHTFGRFSQMLFGLSEGSGCEMDCEEATASPQGKLKIDATVADQYIRYPNDLSLANEARVNTEAMIDQLWELVGKQMDVKPRTYRKDAHKRYMNQTKKNASRSSQRKTMRYLLNCVERNLGHIDEMLDLVGGRAFSLAYRYQRQQWIIRTLYAQQCGMHQERVRRSGDRILRISQPLVRPIVRGKAGKRVEFGAKLGLSLAGGYLTHQTISWDACNESFDLIDQAEAYRLLTGHYLVLIQCDKIYHTNANRSWCHEKGIRMTALPKGPKKNLRACQKKKQRDEYAERNHIEGLIGNAKQALSMNQIKAILQGTCETWIAAILFVLNLSAFTSKPGLSF